MGKIYSKGLFPNKFCSRDVVAEAHPNLESNIMESLIVDNEEDFNYYTNEKLVDVSVNGEVVRLSKNLIKDVISYESLYTYFLNKVRMYDSLGISLLFINKEGLQNKIIIPKTHMAKAISDYVNDPENKDEIKNIDDIVKIRKNFIESLTSSTTASNKLAETDIDYLIDGQNIKIKAIDLLRVIFDENTYNLFKKSKDGIYGISKERIAYTVLLLFEKEELFKRFVFDEDVYRRYMGLKEYKDLDFESINRLNKSDDILPDGTSIIDSININEDFYTEIMKYNNPTYSKLEQAIYIYIRLCDLLVIDDEHYQKSSYNELLGEHEDMNNICKITKDNNKIVSYEFALLFAKLLKNIGITYSTNLNSFMGYSTSKSNIRFRQGEYIVFVDLFKDIIINDFNNVKENKELVSINCENTNEVSRNKFNEILYEVYKKYSLDKEKELQEDKNINEYINNCSKDINISKRDKLFILFKLIGDKRLKGNDSISYVKKIFELIASQDDSLTLNCVSSMVDNHTRPVYIITINEDNNITYVIVNPNSKDVIYNVTRNELLDMFKQEVLVKDDNNFIIGLEDEKDARTIENESNTTSRNK